MLLSDNEIIDWDEWLFNHPKRAGRSIIDLKAEYGRMVAKKRAAMGLPSPNVDAPMHPPAPTQLPVPPTQLPIWAESLRAMPNEIVRSALFNAKNRNRERAHMKHVQIYVVGDGEIRYSGEELRQDDETVWMQVLHLARLQPLGLDIEFKRTAFLRSIDWPTTAYYYERLDACLIRLAATNLALISNRLGRSVGISLIRKYDIDEQTKVIKVMIEPEIMALFTANHYTLNQWDQRLSLPTGLATWLHAYYASHAKPYPIKLETIAEGSGLTFTRKNDLLRSVTAALDSLVSVGFLIGYTITNGLVAVER